MIAVTIFVLCAVPWSLGHPIHSSPPIPHFVEGSVNDLINVNKDAAAFVTKGLGELNTALSTVLKGIIDGIIVLAGPALDVGAEKINHFLDSKVDIEVIKTAVEVSVKALEVEVKLLNTLGKKLLEVTKNVVDSKLDLWNSLGRTYFEALEEASNQSGTVLKQYLSGQAKNLNEEYHKTRLGFDAAYHALPKGELIHKS